MKSGTFGRFWIELVLCIHSAFGGPPAAADSAMAPSSNSWILSALGAALSAIPSSGRGAAVVTDKRDPSLNAIERDLAAKFDQLKQSADGAGCLNLAWLQEAMWVVLSTSSVVEALIPDLCLPISDRDDKWIDDYLDDSAKLLDVCNVLKEGTMDAENYQMLIQHALRSLDSSESLNKYYRARAALSECIDTIKKKDEQQQRSKLESCSSTLRRMGEKLVTPTAHDAKGKAFMSSVYGSKVCTIFICGLLAAALSFKPRRPLSTIHVSSQYLWSSSMLSLQQKVKEEMERGKSKGSITHLHELYRVDSIVESLHDFLDRVLLQKSIPLSVEQSKEFRQLTEDLRKSSAELEEGLRALEQQVNELFRTLVATRVALLDILSHSRN